MSFAGTSAIRCPMRAAIGCAVAAVFCTLALSTSAFASDEAAVGDGLPAADAIANADGSLNSAFISDDGLGGVGQLQAAQRLIERWRDANRFLALCIGNKYEACRAEAKTIAQSLERQGLTVATWAHLAPIRNNMYFYLLAPRFRNASAIARQGSGCAQWGALAASDKTSLRDLLSDAVQEVGRQTGAPESKELKRLQALFGPCVAAAGGD